MEVNSLLYSYKAKIKNIKLPDLKINAGELVFLEAKDVSFSNIFISIILNQIKLEAGKLVFSGSNPSINNYNKISYISNSFYFPFVSSINTLVKIIALKKNLKYSLVYNNFLRILKNIDIEYVVDMDLKDINFNSKKKIITALTLACPMLLTILNEPFIDIDTETKEYFYNEIYNLSNEGNAFIIIASEPANLNYKTVYRGF